LVLCARASCASPVPSPVLVTIFLVGLALAALAVAARLSRPMPLLVRVTGALVGCARTSSLPSAFLAVAARLPTAMPLLVRVTGALVGCARAGCACLRVAAIRCPYLGGSPSKGNAVTSTSDLRLGRLCSRWLRLHVVAAISCPCCGGSPFKSNAVTSACDWRLGRLCSRWLRLHSCRCHQLLWLWRLAFQEQCRH
jgi:hypothetical protein